MNSVGGGESRPDGAYLQPTDKVPDADELIENAESGVPEPEEQETDEDEGPMDPIDARDDFDGPNDIPAVDLE